MLSPSIRPALHAVSRLMGRKPLDVMDGARERWEVAPGCTLHVRPAIMLPGQIERIRATEFGTMTDVVRDFRGDFDSVQGPTMGYVIRDAVLMDGVLYAGNTARHLQPGGGRRPLGWTRHRPGRSAMYETWIGNRWFGSWLSEDCLTFPLAEAAGTPVTTRSPIGHQSDYEARLGMDVERPGPMVCEELVLFDDGPHNFGKRDRANEIRRRLIGVERPRHPGVFLLRGTAGDRRVLENELDIAEHLAARRGFTVLDPMAATVEQIIDICAGAEVVAGVEGSHLVHGLILMPPGATALVIQPPTRTVAVLKLLTDRQGQNYATVVGTGGHDVFHASLDEIDRTLDLV